MRVLLRLAEILLASAILFAANPAAAQNSLIAPPSAVVSLDIGLVWPAIGPKPSGLGRSMALTISASKIGASIGISPLAGSANVLLPLQGWTLPRANLPGRMPRTLINPARSRPVNYRPGYVGSLAWNSPGGTRIELFQYDSRVSPEAVHPTLQWGQETNFTDIGVRLPFGRQHWELRAQGMAGSTQTGVAMPNMTWIDTDFRAAYGMVTRRFQRGSASIRAEWFRTRNNGSIVTSQEDENGWALTGAAKRDLGHGFILRGEFMHLESSRVGPIYAGRAPTQRQNVAQISLRLSA